MKKSLFFLLIILMGFQYSFAVTRPTPVSKSNVQYFNFPEGQEIPFNTLTKWMHAAFNTGDGFDLAVINTATDVLGITTYRYQQTWNGVPVQGSMWLAHVKGDKIISCNGTIYPVLSCPLNATIVESAARDLAINYIHADTYQWQNPGSEQLIKYQTNNPQATYYPAANLVLAPVNGNYVSGSFRLAYRFDIYASKPLSRDYVFVDAQTGQIIYKLNEICTTNATGTAYTGYLGVKTITTDSFSGGYRLRETGRGNGIETYNLQTGTDYTQAIDFTNATTTWNDIDAALDQYATDAHYGAEMTYDYYKTKFNRSSVDNMGLKLLSYVHYSVNYFNAFWDGSVMTYGDGNGKPLTCIDITGHEISHGVTQYTAALVYQDEPGALNEGYSDCMGTGVEFYGATAVANWTIGEDLGTPFRSMSDPKLYGQPDTYLGQDWYTGTSDDGGVHTNSGVLNHWFYLTSVGGSGTNDDGNSFNVTGITIDEAEQILYRAWTVYMTPTSQYSDARLSTIQSAIDIYGACSPEVTTVTNAWYAVGVGATFSSHVTSDFSADVVNFCSAPATVNFKNMSTNAGTFRWDFGDGTTSTAFSPTHIYNSLGTYSVKLVAIGGSCGSDSVTKASYININTSIPCLLELPDGGPGATQTSCNGTLYDDGGPNGNYTDQTDSWITIAPNNATGVKLSFTTFDLEDLFDYLYIYDGPSTSSPLIGKYTGNIPPNGGVIYPTGVAVTIRLISDQAVNDSGFAVSWQCINAPPVVAFTSDVTQTCTGIISFTDQTRNSPTGWHWDFGDGTTSVNQNPVHTYAQNGTYSVKLVASNSLGSDSLTHASYITVNKPGGPLVTDAFLCAPATANLGAVGLGTFNWYNSASGGTLLHTGTSYTTPVINTTTNYYVAEVEQDPIQSGGKPDSSGGGGYFANQYDRYLTFDVYQQVELKSVTVYAQGAGNRTIEWRNSSGVTIKDTTINMANGTDVITLKWRLLPGTNYEMAINGTANLYRNNVNAVLPYTTPGYLSITGTNSGQAGFYYYFYNWQLQPYACLSQRSAATAFVGNANGPMITPPGDTVSGCTGKSILLSAPANASGYKWSNGQTTQSIYASANSSYSVIITLAGGCVDTSTVVALTSNPAPTALFTFTGNAGNLVSFTNSSVGATSYFWNFGDNSQIDTVRNPTHSYLTGNTYPVSLVACNGGCCDTVTENITVEAGVLTINANSKIKIYPNPTSDVLFIQSEMDVADLASSVYLTNLLDQQLPLKIVSIGKNTVQIDMANFAAGTYFVRVHNQTIDEVAKIIKVKE